MAHSAIAAIITDSGSATECERILSSTYLTIAKDVLARAKRPLTARQILDQAYIDELVPSHLHGATQHKTLQARLSEDISALPDGSDFVRTGPGAFFLRSLWESDETPPEFRVIYKAPPRKKELKRDLILCIELGSAASDGYLSIRYLKTRFNQGHYRHLRWDEVRGNSSFSPVASFVVVYDHESLLSYRSGKFRPEADVIKRPRSVGFGGVVLSSDGDLLYNSFYGIFGSGLNELTFGVGLPRELAAKARYGEEMHPVFGHVVQSPLTSTTFVNIVMSYRRPDGFIPFKGALSLNELRWIRWSERANRPADFDATSQEVLRDPSRFGIS